MDRTLFHLQLAFQKLEEEVKLYRNGTTSENLLDLLHEKDREIVQLKGVVSETTDKLRRIAKGSSELIVRCENLQRERDAALKGEQLVNECLATQGSEMKLLQEEKASVFEALQSSIESITERDEKIKDLADQINKLQAQCASLVSKKSDLDRLLEKEKAERRETIKEFSAQLEKGIKFNMEMKERLRDEQASNVNVSSSLSEMTARLTRAEQAKHEIVSELEGRISTLQSQLECSELKNQEAQISMKVQAQENVALNEQLSRLEIEMRKQDAILRLKGLRDRSNIPDLGFGGEISHKPSRHAAGK